MMWVRLFASGALIVGLAGCAAQPPSKVPVKDITPLQALENGNAGDQVRWGGPILAVEPKQGECKDFCVCELYVTLEGGTDVWLPIRTRSSLN
jgi:starvation-inducible outer membrane lipoprotein